MYAAPMASKDLTPAPGEIAALLGRGTKFRGKLVFEGRVRVDGAFDGEVHTEGVLVVGEEAVLDGTFDVGSLLVLGGTVRGKVRAREVIELHADSHVLAELETPRLFVDKGARFDGSCRMTDGAPSQRLPLDESERPASSDAPSGTTAPSPTTQATEEASADEGTTKEEPAERRDVPEA
jgi:cytoskeletal protein CcmA (bactofilin family)